MTVKLGASVKGVADRLEKRYPGVAAITEPGQAIKVDTSTRLIVTSGWIVSLLALIVGGISVTNTMAMSVYERTREIGILRAVGWPAARVGLMIAWEALGICLIALGVDGFRWDSAKEMDPADIAAIEAMLTRQVFIYQDVQYGAGQPVTPEEYEQIKRNELQLPHGWTLGPVVPKPHQRGSKT